MSRPWVYIASAYTNGDTAINTRFQMRMWDVLFDVGVIPIAPLWSHFQHLHNPRPYRDWVDYDNEIIRRCDACFRLTVTDTVLDYRQAESSGADAEVQLFLLLGKPVFYEFWDLNRWLDTLATEAAA